MSTSTGSRWPAPLQGGLSPSVWQPIIVALVLGLGATILQLREDVARLEVRIGNIEIQMRRAPSFGGNTLPQYGRK